MNTETSTSVNTAGITTPVDRCIQCVINKTAQGCS